MKLKPRTVRQLQTQFFSSCINTQQTLDEILDDLEIPAETLAGWLTKRDFRVRLHGMRRYARKARELSIEIGALRGATQLLRATTSDPDDKTTVQSVARAACIDLIRLARDSRARAKASNPSVDDLTKNRHLYHPDLPKQEAQLLIEELSRRAEDGDEPK